MIEKPLIIIVFMYAVSFSLLGGQYVMDSFGIEMTNAQGTALKSELLAIVGEDELNTSTSTLTNLNGTSIETDPIGSAAGLVVDVLQLLTGTYIFNILFLFGVPPIFIYGLTTLYAIMLMRAIIGYLRGI